MGSGEPSVLLADPIVVLSVNAVAQSPVHAIPDQTATVALQGLGVQTLVVDRDALPETGRVLVDQLLGRYLRAPQRDLVGRVDVYAVERGVGADAEPALLMGGAMQADGYLDQASWLEEHPPGR